MFKALLLPNYISEQPQYFRNSSNFAKYWRNNIIYIVTFKGHFSPKLTVSSSCYKFSKIFKHCHSFLLWHSLYLGSNLARNEKTKKVGYLCRLGSLVMVNLLISQTVWYFAIKFSKVKDNFIRKQFFQIWAKTINKENRGEVWKFSKICSKS